MIRRLRPRAELAAAPILSLAEPERIVWHLSHPGSLPLSVRLRARLRRDDLGDADQFGHARIGGGDLVVLRQALQQVVHARRRRVERRDHVRPECGLVGVTLGIARDECQLAHQILDVVHDEGEAAVELVEARGIAECVLALGFGKIACDLASGEAKQVEILPVERTRKRGPLEQHRAD